MKTKTAKRLIVVAIVIVALISAILLWPGSPLEYEFTYIDLRGGVAVSAINNNGQAVGVARIPSGLACACIWDPASGRKFIPTPPGGASRARDINDKGQVIGRFSTPDKKRAAFIWDKKTGLTELGTLDGDSIVPQAINNNGQVTGWVETESGQKHAFLWDKANGMKNLGTLHGADCYAYDINDKGQVIGNLIIQNKQSRPFIWEQELGMVEITAPANMTTFVASINNNGQVAGYQSSRDITKPHGHAVVWTRKSGFRKLGVSAVACYATAINDSGQVIGYYRASSSLIRKAGHFAFLLDPGRGMVDLGEVLQSGEKYIYTKDINNKGQILATVGTGATAEQAVILTPKAESKEENE